MQNCDEHNINYEYITRYIRRTMKKRTGLLAEMEAYAKEHGVPIAQPETAGLLELLVRFSGAGRILEIGSAIGYSAIIMAECGAHVTTIERDAHMFAPLAGFIARAGMQERICVCRGDALELLRQMDGCFDLIFMDAAKAQYLEFLPHCLRMLRPGGMLFSDNILYKGMVATDELFQRRKVTIIRRLRRYLDELCSRADLQTVILPVGDGAALSYKKGEGTHGKAGTAGSCR